MKVLKLKNAHKFNLKNSPSDDIKTLPNPSIVGLSFLGVTSLKIKALVKQGDTVSLNEPIAEIKKHPEVKFCAPASGTIQEINFGPKRVLENIVIKTSEQEDSSPKKELSLNLSKETLKPFLLENGYWPFFLTFPQLELAPLGYDEDHKIQSLYLNLSKTEPFHPNQELVLKDNIDILRKGIEALSLLSNNVKIFTNKKDQFLHKHLSDYPNTYMVEDQYPADHIGAQAWHTEKLQPNHIILGAETQLILDVGHHILTGSRRLNRLYSLSGNAVKNPKHVLSRVGTCVGDLIKDEVSNLDQARILCGGIFTGTKVRFKDFTSPKDSSIQVLFEDKNRIPLVFFRLGIDKFTLSKNWLSGFFSNTPKEATTSNNGQERACIQCGYCIDVCPVYLLPNLLMKAQHNQDIEKMRALDIDECIDCGLCTFVCPSKIELGKSIIQGKNLVNKEG